MTDKNKKLKKEEVGFKIKDVYTENNKLVVKVDDPEPELGTRVFTFGPEMRETKKYVEDGEVSEEPKLKLDVRKKLERDYEEEEISLTDEEKEELKGQRITSK